MVSSCDDHATVVPGTASKLTGIIAAECGSHLTSRSRISSFSIVCTYTRQWESEFPATPSRKCAGFRPPNFGHRESSLTPNKNIRQKIELLQAKHGTSTFHVKAGVDTISSDSQEMVVTHWSRGDRRMHGILCSSTKFAQHGSVYVASWLAVVLGTVASSSSVAGITTIMLDSGHWHVIHI